MSGCGVEPGPAARFLVERYGPRAERRGGPIWFRIDGTDGREEEVGAGLLGVRVPERFEAVAVVATGRLRTLEAGVELPPGLASGCHGGLRLACVLRRDGQLGWQMVVPGGTAFEEAPQEGRMLDVLQRSLGLPTAPPARSVAALEAAMWVGAICAVTCDSRNTRLTWSQAVSLYPAMRERAATAGPLQPSFDDDPVSDWEALRRMTGREVEPDGIVEPRLARWMDAGMFSRWVLDSVGPPERLIDLARPCLDPSAARRLAHHVRLVAA